MYTYTVLYGNWTPNTVVYYLRPEIKLEFNFAIYGHRRKKQYAACSSPNLLQKRGFPNDNLMIFVWNCQLSLLFVYKAEISKKLPFTLNNGLVANKR